MSNPFIEAKRTGLLWIHGEMEIPYPCDVQTAFVHAARVAESCGYVVQYLGISRLQITGGDLPGYVVLDWFNDTSFGPTKLETWHCEAKWSPESKGGQLCQQH